MLKEDDMNRKTEPKIEVEIEVEYEPVHCPVCGAPMTYNFEYEIENDDLYSASGHYDGVHINEWFDCPGCDYRD
jgi:hypothetical protein